MRGMAFRGILFALAIPMVAAGCATKKPETETGATGAEIGPFSDGGVLVGGDPAYVDPFGAPVAGPDGALIVGGPGGSLVDGALAGQPGGTVVIGPDGQEYDLGGGSVAYGPGYQVDDTAQRPSQPAYTGSDPRFPGDDGTAQYFSLRVGDRVLFGTDRYELTPEAREVLQRQAAWLKLHTGSAVMIEGHADERGTREYNLALGARRANAVRSYLVSLGVPTDRISTVSYGKERPVEACSAARCWTQNRRAVTVVRGGFS